MKNKMKVDYRVFLAFLVLGLSGIVPTAWSDPAAETVAADVEAEMTADGESAVEGDFGADVEEVAPREIEAGDGGIGHFSFGATACDFEEWVGFPVDEDALKAANRPYRILRPGDAATMDYNAERINVEVNDNDIVLNIRCG